MANGSKNNKKTFVIGFDPVSAICGITMEYAFMTTLFENSLSV